MNAILYQSQLSGKKSNWAFRYRGLISGIILVPVVFVVLISKPLISEGTWLDLAVDLLAWQAFVAGLVFRLWPTLYIGGRKCQIVVRDGPYSICRNPLYLGSFFLALSAGFFLKSILFAGFLGIAVLAYILKTIPAEEAELRRALGEPYLDYCKQVSRFWPNFSLFKTPATVEVTMHGLRIEAKRALVWVWLPFAGELIAHLRVEEWWPQFFHLL